MTHYSQTHNVDAARPNRLLTPKTRETVEGQKTTEQELRQIGLRWTQIEHQAQDREQWKKKTMDELCFK